MQARMEFKKQSWSCLEIKRLVTNLELILSTHAINFRALAAPSFVLQRENG
jgi:hypothetical protein